MLALRLPAEAWQTITWREGAADWLSSRFARQRVRPAHRDTLLTEPRAEEYPCMPAQAADASAHANRPQWLNYQEGDFVIRNYVFRTGETLPELKFHYRGANWLRPSLADELFAPGQPLDASELRTESATRIQELAPTRAAADKLCEERLAQAAKGDANEFMRTLGTPRSTRPPSKPDASPPATMGQPVRPDHSVWQQASYSFSSPSCFTSARPALRM